MSISDQLYIVLYITAHLHHTVTQSSSACGVLLQPIPIQFEHYRTWHFCLSASQRLMHPALQLQLMSFMSFWGAAGKSVAMGTSKLLWYFHPHLVGERSLPNHCCTCKYVRKECCWAAALVGGKTARVNVAPIQLLAMFLWKHNTCTRPTWQTFDLHTKQEQIFHQVTLFHFHWNCCKRINCDEIVHHGAIAMQKMIGNNFAGIKLRRNDKSYNNCGNDQHWKFAMKRSQSIHCNCSVALPASSTLVPSCPAL